MGESGLVSRGVKWLGVEMIDLVDDRVMSGLTGFRILPICYCSSMILLSGVTVISPSPHHSSRSRSL